MRLTKLVNIRMQLLGPWSVPCTKHSEAWVLNAPVFWVRVQLDAVFFSSNFMPLLLSQFLAHYILNHMPSNFDKE